MTALAKPEPWTSPEDYLAWETAQEARYEYFEGGIFSMAEASPNHSRLALNIASSLRDQLRGRKCEGFMETMKVGIPPLFGTGFFYPDVIVVCEAGDQERSSMEDPTAVFEVLSASTMKFNQEVKTPAYMHLPSLQFLGVVSQDEMRVVVRGRRAGAGWEMEEFTQAGDVIRIEAIGCELKLAEIYERVKWPPAPASA